MTVIQKAAPQVCPRTLDERVRQLARENIARSRRGEQFWPKKGTGRVRERATTHEETVVVVDIHHLDKRKVKALGIDPKGPRIVRVSSDAINEWHRDRIAARRAAEEAVA